MKDKKIVGFKKFSDIKSSKESKENEQELDITPLTDSDIPMSHNLPSDKNKVERASSRRNTIPKTQDTIEGIEEYEDIEKETETKNENVRTYGKVAKFPKNVKASKAYNFLENVKVSKKSIWYIMIEKENELQMVKYNHKEGVELAKFVNELKSYYISKYKGDKTICESINNIEVDGNDKYSMIKNIPPLKVDNRFLISKITEDLISLLSK